VFHFPFLSITAPEGVFPPSLTALSSTSVQIRFQSPLTPNGVITLYTISRLNPPQTFSYTDLLSNADRVTLTDENLSPFTEYMYTLEVCTEGGCTSSVSATVQTLEDLPTGFVEPSVSIISHQELLVEWLEPTMPNGVIIEYELLRRFVGFESIVDEGNCCEDYSASSSLTDGCEYVSRLSGNTTSHIDSGLQPFTFYQYCIIGSNSLLSSYSNQSTPVQTEAALMPIAGPVLTAATVNSTAIELSWSAVGVEDLLGPLEGYSLYISIAGEPGPGELLLRGDALGFTATDLVASTQYVFVVSVSNGRGDTFSNNASAITDEGSKSL